MSRLRRGGWLTDEDLRVWVEVARTARPLRGKVAPSPPQPAASQDAAPAMKPAPGQARATPAPSLRGPPSAPPLASLERRFVQRLRRGTASPGAVIDLHGLRQEDARHRLVAFLHRCQADGAKAAIVITGKGAEGDAMAGGRGVLRRSVPLWLALPELRPLVVGFEAAGAGLGGSGALIVRIRARARPMR